ncbi:transposase family protein [Kineococcus glutinatus]|uniref:IS5-like element IS470 family transposase n=1 Tax=Kineococcus glutinatus TaxID=1070872 RepID=A0ABP9HZ21_9ACTN
MSHRARLDVPAPTLRTVTGWIAAARRGRDRRPWQRAATVHQHVLLVLRWLRHRADLADLAHDAHISIATAYRYLHEALDAIAAHAPDLHDVLHIAREKRLAYLCLDGTLVATDRVTARTERGNDAWYSGKHHRHGGNVQVLADPDGHPLWVSAVRPGARHDLACARELVLPALYPFCRLAPDRHSHLPVLADKGYVGAGIGVRVPYRRPAGGQRLDRTARTYNRCHAALRAPAERAISLLGHWRALDHVTLDPGAITKIASVAFVLTHLQLPTR